MAVQDSFELSATLDATAMQVLFAFLSPEAVKNWWGAKTAIVQPRPGGLFVVEWEAGKPGQDELLGPLGGTLVGTLDKAMAGHCIYFGNLQWMTPRGEVFGPTRLEVDVFSKNDPRRKPTLLRVRSSGYLEGERWARYCEMMRRAWQKNLESIAAFCAQQSPEEADRTVGVLGSTYLAEAVLQGRRIS
jgi:uncharacterized protein YndB with AHSA1/START domain